MVEMSTPKTSSTASVCLLMGRVVNVSGSDGEVVIVWKGVKHVETSALERMEVLLEIMIQRLELRVLSEEVLLPGAICNARDV